MQILSGSTLRRLLPAITVAGVLALSYVAQTPSLASSSDVGYGYANNCGVKGDGFHDHGKVCPNRPFPGHGKGVLDILSGISPSSAHSENHDISGTSTVMTGAGTSGGSEQGVTSSGRHHGHGHAKGHANRSAE